MMDIDDITGPLQHPDANFDENTSDGHNSDTSQSRATSDYSSMNTSSQSDPGEPKPQLDLPTVAFPSPAKVVNLDERIAAKRIPGRGVGVIALHDIPAKTTILIEKPLLSWKRGTYNARTLASRMLHLKDHAFLTSTLFPTSLNDIPEPRRQQFSTSYLDSIVSGSKASRSHSPPPPPYSSPSSPNNPIELTADQQDALRIHYCLDCNSFPSGIMLALSYCNHSCDPNSKVTEFEDEDTTQEIKASQASPFVESSNSIIPDFTEMSLEENSETEVKVLYHLSTTRKIHRGEEITISYVDFIANLDLAEDRRRYLDEHYLFHCSCPMCEIPLNEGFQCRAEVGVEDVRVFSHIMGKSTILLDSQIANSVTSVGIESNETVQSPSKLACPGEINPRTGTCGTCLKPITEKELSKLITRSDKVVLKARHMVVETVQQIEAAESFLEGNPPPKTRLPEQLAPELLKKRITKLHEIKLKATELLHPNHLLFMAVDSCSSKLKETIESLQPFAPVFAVDSGHRDAKAGKKKKRRNDKRASFALDFE
ncbi:hypothetical protein HDU97_005944 [Phlyctochytrium planicorne]|nr:hypothetical protein HDU97_005944 [Phlyctochytrium planicorne]